MNIHDYQQYTWYKGAHLCVLWLLGVLCRLVSSTCMMLYYFMIYWESVSEYVYLLNIIYMFYCNQDKLDIQVTLQNFK